MTRVDKYLLGAYNNMQACIKVLWMLSETAGQYRPPPLTGAK